MLLCLQRFEEVEKVDQQILVSCGMDRRSSSSNGEDVRLHHLQTEGTVKVNSSVVHFRVSNNDRELPVKDFTSPPGDVAVRDIPTLDLPQSLLNVLSAQNIRDLENLHGKSCRASSPSCSSSIYPTPSPSVGSVVSNCSNQVLQDQPVQPSTLLAPEGVCCSLQQPLQSTSMTVLSLENTSRLCHVGPAPLVHPPPRLSPLPFPPHLSPVPFPATDDGVLGSCVPLSGERPTLMAGQQVIAGLEPVVQQQPLWQQAELQASAYNIEPSESLREWQSPTFPSGSSHYHVLQPGAPEMMLVERSTRVHASMEYQHLISTSPISPPQMEGIPG